MFRGCLGEVQRRFRRGSEEVQASFKGALGKLYVRFKKGLRKVFLREV